ncbi:MAG: hypothetical protein QXH20_00360 [Candidatus Bathyarchaeia archaeon]
MSRWGLTYKGVEILTPEEWNNMVMALNDLDNRSPLQRACGKIRFTGDGSTTTFYIPHNFQAEPHYVNVVSASPNLPDIDYIIADDTNITVTFKQAPPTGDFYLYWIALRFTS